MLGCRFFLLVAVSVFLFGCVSSPVSQIKEGNGATEETDSAMVVRVDTSHKNLVIYSFETSHLNLVFGDMPDTTISNICFVCAAAFTGQRLNSFQHSNIAGDHVAEGNRYHGYKCPRNTGAFVCYNHRWRFLYKEYNNELDLAANNNGIGFSQEMLIHNGIVVPHSRLDNEVNIYRTLCDINGQLAIVDSKGVLEFGVFIENLLEVGVVDALYMDMGDWKQSWYREHYNSKPVIIYPKNNEFGTNWFVVYASN